jgi:hypothetical protein
MAATPLTEPDSLRIGEVCISTLRCFEPRTSRVAVPLMGRQLAQRTLGMSDAELAFPVTPLRPIPFHRAASLGARAAIQYLRAVDLVARARDSLRRRAPWT